MYRILTILSIALCSSTAYADLSYSIYGSVYAQNFDTLSMTGGANTWIDDTTLTGWFSNRTTYRATNGSGTSGGLHSFGSTGFSDRALGTLPTSSTGTIRFGARFTNNTGKALTTILVQYDGEQWRDGGTPNLQSLTFDYKVDPGAIGINDAGFTSASALNFTGPIATNTAGTLDGNAAPNRANIFAKVKIGTWNPGERLMIRWTDINNLSVPDHGLSIDNISFSAIPEPASSGAMGVLAVFATVTRLRRMKSKK